jgi:hypothetical protein
MKNTGASIAPNITRADDPSISFAMIGTRKSTHRGTTIMMPITPTTGVTTAITSMATMTDMTETDSRWNHAGGVTASAGIAPAAA